MNRIKALLEYKRTYANWISAALHSITKKEKIIKVKLRNGDILNMPREMVIFTVELSRINNSLDGFEFDSQNEIFTFQYLGKSIKMKFYENGKFNGDVSSFLGIYDFLEPIEGDTVIDIGANIGDSCVWFANKGASKVIGLEPYRYSYDMAIKNVEINNLASKVVILNAGYGPTGEIELEDTITDGGALLTEHKGGIKTPLFTLKDILSKYQPEIKGDLKLKMDCEGCEYNLLNEGTETLRMFNKIIIEYHNGYERLYTKLRECDFDVRYTQPHKFYDKDTDRTVILGYIYAKQMN